MFSLCLENPRMQLWITAAQPSVAEQAVYYDNGMRVECRICNARVPLLPRRVLAGRLSCPRPSR